jgi:hypothetical protein
MGTSRRIIMLKRDSSANSESTTPFSEAPYILRVAIERLMLEATEELDPLISLMLTNLTIDITDAAYNMGKRDGRLLMSSSK